MIKWPDPKDPDEVLDYTLLWVGTASEPGALYGTGDEIVSSVWLNNGDEVDYGINIDRDTNTTSTATVWLSGGTLGENYEVTNRIRTRQNRTLDETIKVRVRRR